jgi:hypothetical protein
MLRITSPHMAEAARPANQLIDPAGQNADIQ